MQAEPAQKKEHYKSGICESGIWHLNEIWRLRVWHLASQRDLASASLASGIWCLTLSRSHALTFSRSHVLTFFRAIAM